MKRIEQPSLKIVRRSGLSVLLAGLLAAVYVAAPAPSAAQSASALDELRYDISARPVAQALTEFATVSGVSIIYRQSLAGDRRSTALSGTFTAPAALRRLLDGTGLSARFTSPTSAIIYVEGQPPPLPQMPGASAGTASLRLDMAEVRAPRMIGTTDRGAFNRYARQVQAEIFVRLKEDGAYEGRRFRIEIGVTVDPAGRIADVAFLRPSGEPAWDARVRQTLVGAMLSAPPPEGFTRSMRFEVETDRLADRAAAGGRRRP